MEPRALSQIPAADLRARKVDLLVCASGFEKRATFAASHLLATSARRVALGFAERADHPARLRNDEWYRERGFDLITVPGSDDEMVESLFEQLCQAVNTDRPTIAVDISSMTRAWYGGILRYLRATSQFENASTLFLYTPARFSKPNDPYPQNQHVGPVRGFTGLCLPARPSALIVGLGHDSGRAIGIHEEIDPWLAASFVAKPGVESRYEISTERANSDFLRLVPPEYRFDYPIGDFLTAFHRLEGVCRGLSRVASVVMAPLGPKVFSLCCFIVALLHPEISVWRVSAGSREQPREREPAGKLVSVALEWARRSTAAAGSPPPG